MVPGYTRAELEYRVYSPLGEPVIQGSEDFEELPDWVDVGVYGRDHARFAPPAAPDGAAGGRLLEDLGAAQTMYRIVASLPVRPWGDLHLEYALEAAAEIAEASAGVVLDVVTRRLYTAAEFTALAEAEDHAGEYRTTVETAAQGDGWLVRSVGMRKFGYVDVAVGPVRDPGVAAARLLVEDACAGLVDGEARPGDAFEYEGLDVRIEPVLDAAPLMGGALMLRRVDGGPLEELLALIPVDEETAEYWPDAGDAEEGGEPDEVEAPEGAEEVREDDVVVEAEAGAPGGGAERPLPPATAAPAPPEPGAIPDVDRTLVAGDIRKILTPAELRVLVDEGAPAELLHPASADADAAEKPDAAPPERTDR
ncbi:MAG TPA: hypothetical protein VG389_02020 [Myxococcota bacterium]|jgi:hypothetical protein|nr:hypothetical protein [Myxococcota bacterium]